MSKPIEASEKISVSFNKVPNETDFVTIEDNGGYVFVDISDWENLKQVVDKLIADNKDG